jgi:hypothetical protein
MMRATKKSSAADIAYGNATCDDIESIADMVYGNDAPL